MPPTLGGVTNVISIVVFTVLGLIVLAIVVTVFYWGSRWWVAKLSPTLNRNHQANDDHDEMANVQPPPPFQPSSSHPHRIHYGAQQTSEGEQDLSGTVVDYGVDVDNDANSAA